MKGLGGFVLFLSADVSTVFANLMRVDNDKLGKVMEPVKPIC